MYPWWRFFWSTWGLMCVPNFAKIGGILKSISRNRDMGVFLTWYFMKTHKKGIYPKTSISPFYANFCLNRSICWDARLIWNWQVFCEYLYKGWTVYLFEIFSCFPKNRRILKCFDIFLEFERKGSFKKLKFSWFHCKKGYFFPKDFLKRVKF